MGMSGRLNPTNKTSSIKPHGVAQSPRWPGYGFGQDYLLATKSRQEHDFTQFHHSLELIGLLFDRKSLCIYFQLQVKLVLAYNNWKEIEMAVNMLKWRTCRK